MKSSNIFLCLFAITFCTSLCIAETYTTTKTYYQPTRTVTNTVIDKTTNPMYSVDKIQTAEQTRLAKLAETIPDANAFWYDTPAYDKSATKNYLPLLNFNLSELSPQMKRYMVSVGNDFSKNWPKNMISGAGLCKIEFTINKDGTINKSKIVEKSENKSLNDSVSMVLTRVTNVDAPPEDYHGERIHLVFQVKDNGNFKIYYP